MVDSVSTGDILGGKEVANAILSVIREARKQLFVVSPYLDLCDWEEAKAAIKKATAQVSNPSIKFVVCKNDQGARTKKSINWLRDKGIPVVEVEKLHFKIYINEKSVVSSSMNLTQSSLKNHELAHQVMDVASQNRMRRQVRNLMTANPREMTVCARCGSLNRPRKRSASQTPAEDLPLCYPCFLEWKKENDLP